MGMSVVGRVCAALGHYGYRLYDRKGKMTIKCEKDEEID